MDSTRLPLTFAPLIEMAERAAIEHSAALAGACTHGGAAGWDSIDEHSRRVRSAAFASLLSALTRPESQALWLRWLAERLGVPVPVVGSTIWSRLAWDGKIVYRLAAFEDGHWFYFGAPTESVGGTDCTDCTFCPDLDNPDSANAPIRALVLVILTVGSR